MARANKTNGAAKEAEKDYIEFNITGAANRNDFEGRLYKEAYIGDKGAWHALSITINGITIKGSKLWIPKDDKKDKAILWPSYQDKDGKSHPFIAIFGKEDNEDIQNLAASLAEKLGY